LSELRNKIVSAIWATVAVVVDGHHLIRRGAEEGGVFFPLYWVSKEGNTKKKSKKEREGGEREVFVPNPPFQYRRCDDD
jgi:hypothetical protein